MQVYLAPKQALPLLWLSYCLFMFGGYGASIFVLVCFMFCFTFHEAY